VLHNTIAKSGLNRVFIHNNCVFCADVGISSEKVQGARTKDQGQTFNLCGFAALGIV